MKRKAVQRATMFIPITRIDEEAREVWGYATTEDVDSFGTVFDYEASKRAYQEWASEFEIRTGGESKGNLRAMHQKIAAGKVIAVQPDDEKRGIYVGTRVVDDAEWAKVKEHVYTGFSHGVGTKTAPKRQRRNGAVVDVYDNFWVEELSLADNPSNPGAVFTIVRMAGDGKREVLAPLEAATKTILEAHRTAASGGVVQAPAPVVAKVPDPPPAAPATETAVAPAPGAPAAPTPTAAEAGSPGPAADGVPAPAATSTPAAAAPPSPPAAARVAVALHFDPAKFTPEKAQEWAQGHDFRTRAARQIGNGTHLEVEQRDVDATDMAAVVRVRLADGVELLSAPLKPDAQAARLAALLDRIPKADIERIAQSQSAAIVPALHGIGVLCDAVSSLFWNTPPGENMTEQAKGDVAMLTTAMEAVLDFIGNRLREQLASVASGAQRAAVSELERFTQLPKILRPAQLQRLMDEGELRENVSAMHEIGHALTDATMKMGSECKAGTCRAAGEEGGAGPDGKPKDGDDQATPPDKEKDEKERVAQPTAVAAAPTPTPEGAASAQTPAAAPAAPASAPAVERTATPGTDQVLQAVATLTDKVTGFQAAITSVTERLQQVESMPAAIGRPPAAPVDKTLAGSTPAPRAADEVSTLTRLAEKETDPQAKAVLLKKAAEVSIRDLQTAGRK